jgi:hypothetical protein
MMAETSERSWSQLTPDEKRERRWAAFVSPGLQFAGPEAAAAYKARATRLKKAISLEGEPDRVPVCALCGQYPAIRAGLTPYDAMNDYPRAAAAWLDFNRACQPDALVAPLFAAIPARAFATLDVAVLSWPGHGAPMTAGFQYNEKEWMLADEYDLLIDDPTDYLLHVWLPRTVPGMSGFAKLTAPMDTVEIVASPGYLMRWADPEVQESLAKLKAAGEECLAWGGAFFPLIGQLVAEGFPGTIGSMSKAPFDVIGDTLRGTRGVVTDMYRQPDRLLEACDRLVGPCVKWVTRNASPFSPPLVFMPLHKGADSFMNDEQFRKFYWPSLRKVIEGLVADGFVPYLFAEGAYNSRLEAIADMPKGKTVWQFDRTDMRRAKEILGGIACIQGNVPNTLLQLGEAQEVRDYCKDLIQAVAPGGGFMLDVGAVVDEAKEENMMAMIDSVRT